MINCRISRYAKMSSNKKQDNAVTVGVRIRPRNEKELAAMMPVCFSATEDAQGVEELDEHGSIVKVWPYDYVFGHECTNQYIFHSVGAKLIDAALEGYNTVLFMYGQTSSGLILFHISFDFPLIYFFRKNVHVVWRSKYSWISRTCYGIW